MKDFTGKEILISRDYHNPDNGFTMNPDADFGYINNWCGTWPDKLCVTIMDQDPDDNTFAVIAKGDSGTTWISTTKVVKNNLVNDNNLLLLIL